MVRVEVAFPLEDKHRNPIDPEALSLIAESIGNHCGGFRMKFEMGFWKSWERIWLLTTETSFENVEWCRKQKEDWREKLNQEEMYMVGHLVERIA